MRVALVLSLCLLAACSSDPVPAPGDVLAADVGDVVDAVDAADAPDATEDRPAPVDVVDVVDVPALEIPDAGEDVGAVADAGLDVPAADAPADVADVPVAVDVGTDAGADVPRDAGPVDAGAVDGGPRVYDLDEVRTEMSAVLLWGLVCGICGGETCEGTVVPSECRLASDGLHFGFSRCGTIAGLTTVGGAGTVTIIGSSQPAQSTTTITAQGSRYVAGGLARRNFHVQFSAPGTSGTAGATGIPGRTVSPTLGDIWLFGCRVD